MNAEIISIGDELTSGQRLDTNSQWLSQRLGELGVKTLFHTTVADDLPANTEAFRIAAERADIIVATGGLGPTADDLTREALSLATGKRLVTYDEALAHIRKIFAGRKRPMPQRNVVQATFPETSRIIPNPHGTAPGIDIDVPRENRPPARIFALPGVPAEMQEMWTETVEPALAAMIGPTRKLIRHRQIKCFGVGESDLEQMLPDLIRRGRQPSVGITVSRATITLRVTAEGDSAEACAAAMAPTIQTIYECLGPLVFGEEEDDLQHAVVRLLAQRKQTLAAAEWGTAGLVCSWLGDVDPTRQVFLGGIVVGDSNSAVAVGGVRQSTIDQQGDAPEQVCEMAARCREKFAADYAIAIGPFPAAGGGGSSADEFHIAVAGPDEVILKSALFAGHPDILKSRAAKQALNLLRLTLIGQ